MSWGLWGGGLLLLLSWGVTCRTSHHHEDKNNSHLLLIANLHDVHVFGLRKEAGEPGKPRADTRRTCKSDGADHCPLVSSPVQVQLIVIQIYVAIFNASYDIELIYSTEPDLVRSVD